MRFPTLIPGRFLRRDNRFRATVHVAGQARWAHVANSGRLEELFQPERPIWLAPAGRPGRKTDYDLKLVEYEGVLVSVDARLPNPLFAEALESRRWPAFDYDVVEREVTLGQSRLDFRLSRPAGVCWVETKSVTLVEEGVALFPDAPTTRGQRHLGELTAVAREGGQAAVVFIIQRPDAAQFRAHETADPVFATALREASASGVSVRAFTCQVSLNGIGITAEIPVRLR